MALGQDFHGYEFRPGTTYILANNTGADQWTISFMGVPVSAKYVRYGVEDRLLWDSPSGKILGPLMIDAIEQVLSENTRPSLDFGEDLLLMTSWFAFWMPTDENGQPTNNEGVSVAIYYDSHWTMPLTPSTADNWGQ